MIISKHQIYNLLKTYSAEGVRTNKLEKKQPAVTAAKSNSLDKTQVSDEAKSFQAAMKAAQGSPDVREGKVAELREAIRTGNYSVSSGEVAEKMITRLLVDKLV